MMTHEQNLELDGQGSNEVVDYVPVMIWRAKQDKLCDWFNKPWREYTGKALKELSGFGWAEDIHPHDRDVCMEVYVRAIDAHQAFSMPMRLRRRDGLYRWFLNNGVPRYRKEKFVGYIGSCVDITDQKDLEEHRAVLLAELNHRVKNNLQLIISFLQISGLKAKGEEARTLLREAINRIQSIGVIQAELHTSDTATVDLAEYLPNLARAVLTARTGGSGGLDVEVMSVRVSIRLASEIGLIANEVITNAVKYADKAKLSLKLTVRKLSDDHVELVIADNGPGFTEAQLRPTAPKQSRLGGLGLVNALALRCRATVSRENDEGAVVRVTFLSAEFSPPGDPAREPDA